MAEKIEVKEERILKKTATVTVYEFEDSEKKIKKISKEKYHKKDIEIHYPWNFDGKPKYPYIKKFIYEGFSGNLPVGVYKVATFGYGFSNKLQPIGDYLGEVLKIEVIKIVKDGGVQINNSTHEIIIPEKLLRKWYDTFQVKINQQKQERSVLAQRELKLAFPEHVENVELKYIKNSIADAITSWDNSITEFSQRDKDAINEMFTKLSLTGDFLDSKTLLDTKTKIDKKYVEDVLVEFKALMKVTTDTETTEKKWQLFLKTHNWIFTYIFSFPIILLEDEAYVGGKSISNQNGKVTDFLVKNNLTENVAFVEIKTHKTDLLKSNKAYRGRDVFAMSPDLSGAVSQVLNQRDNFQKHFSTIKMDSNESFETFNSKCVILIGQIADLNKKQLRPFELLRSNSKDVEILTFDELLLKIENIQNLIEGNYGIKNHRKR